MRIGYVLGAFPRLSETFILTEIVELIKRGHEVFIFSLSRPRESIIYPEVFEYGLMERVYYPPSLLKLRLNIIKPTSLKLLAYRHRGIKAKFYSISYTNYFANMIKRLGIDVLHAHFATRPAFTAMLISKLSNIPYTFTAHAYDIFLNPDIHALKERMINALTTITISYYNRKYLSKITGISEDLIHVVRACPNLDRLNRIKRKEKEFIVLTVARLVEKKGIKYAIMAMKEVVKEFPKVEYRIVGTGPQEKELKDLVRSLGLERNVCFLGALSWEELSREYAKASIFVLPCVRAKNGDMDGIPVALMEAMYLQIPVISTRISGIPELVENYREGILTEPRSIKQLADALQLLLSDPKLRKDMGYRGREKILREFNIKKEVDKLLNIWKQGR